MTLVGCAGADDAPEATANAMPSAALADDAPPPDDEPRPYDPGPYFTPSRQAPSNPAAFVPPAEVGPFTQTYISGRCPQRDGLQSLYQNPDNRIVILYCYHTLTPAEALSRLRGLRDSGAIAGEPIFFEIQDGKSFALGDATPGTLYAWTHERWVFIAHSLGGRAALDAFMEAFPH
ncbi:MAG: hypothetical protein ACLFTK_13590 [Anaerolineales bacterium]